MACARWDLSMTYITATANTRMPMAKMNNKTAISRKRIKNVGNSDIVKLPLYFSLCRVKRKGHNEYYYNTLSPMLIAQ